MINFKPTLLILIFSLVLSPVLKANKTNPDAILGYWMTAEGKAKVQIYKHNNKYYGKIVWLKNPNYDNGEPKVDKNNPEEKYRNRPILGLLLIRGFEYDGGNVWDDGNIYDPESGKDYSCVMTLVNPNTLNVRGYIGFSLLGRTQTWTRAK